MKLKIYIYKIQCLLLFGLNLYEHIIIITTACVGIILIILT